MIERVEPTLFNCYCDDCGDSATFELEVGETVTDLISKLRKDEWLVWRIEQEVFLFCPTCAEDFE